MSVSEVFFRRLCPDYYILLYHRLGTNPYQVP